MSNVLVNDTSLTSIGNAIRTKLGVQTTYKPAEMPAAILSIPTGGGGDDEAFWKSVTERTFSSVTSSTASFIATDAFTYHTTLTSASFPNVTTVGNYAFDNCTSLSSLSMPSVTQVGERAFRACRSLPELDSPLCQSIGKEAFMSAGVQSATYSQCVTVGQSAFLSSSVQTVSLPSCTSVGQSAFQNCTALTTVSIGSNNGTTLGDQCFYHCTSLEDVNIRLSQTYIPSQCFSGCTNLYSAIITFPSNQDCSISPDAFNSCRRLSDIVLYGRVTQVGASAFKFCSNLSAFAVGQWQYLESIGEYGLHGIAVTDLNIYNCETVESNGLGGMDNLTSIRCDGLVTIGTRAFAFDEVLPILELPKARAIGAGAFMNCHALTTLVVGTNNGDYVCSLDMGTSQFTPFYGTPIESGSGYIYVPDNLVNDYKNETGWSNYANQIKGISELP